MLTLFVVNSLIVACVVVLHYECLFRMTLWVQKIKVRHRLRILFGVVGALIAHAVEVWIFALAYYLMDRAEGWGHLAGSTDGSLFDCVYFSFTTFTTLGFGDIQPVGDLRYLTGIEALSGLVLITWTASFLFVEMQRYWNAR
nr:potassium channel family protein [uncultured Pseudomonas sp.]